MPKDPLGNAISFRILQILQDPENILQAGEKQKLKRTSCGPQRS